MKKLLFLFFGIVACASSAGPKPVEVYNASTKTTKPETQIATKNATNNNVTNNVIIERAPENINTKNVNTENTENVAREEYMPQEQAPATDNFDDFDNLLLADLEQYPKKTGSPYVIKGVTYYPLDSVERGYVEVGVASWYGKDFHGKNTSNGEIYDMHAMTAAHKTLPIPTYLKIENLENGKEIVVRVNDRGPFSKGRIIDLSYAAAEKLEIVNQGTAKVKLTVLSQTKDHLRTENKDVDINTGKFAVQIGSFQLEDNAKKLLKKHTNAYIVENSATGNTLYRVQLRGYTSKASAQTAAQALDSQYPGAFVIAE